MALPLLLMALGAAASAGSNIYKSHQANKYQRQQEAYAEKQKAENEKQRRKSALARAIGGEKMFDMTNKPANIPAPKAPNTLLPDIIGSLGGLAGNLGASYGPKMPAPYTGGGGGGGSRYFAM